MDIGRVDVEGRRKEGTRERKARPRGTCECNVDRYGPAEVWSSHIVSQSPVGRLHCGPRQQPESSQTGYVMCMALKWAIKMKENWPDACDQNRSSGAWLGAQALYILANLFRPL